MNTELVFPGDLLNSIDPRTTKNLHPSTGLYRPDQEGSFIATRAGSLENNPRKKVAWIDAPRARYIPRVGDLVIAQVQRSSTDFYHLNLSSYSPQAVLPQLAFEGASKKTRPQLKLGDLVYGKVLFASKNMEVELTCVDPSTGKAEPDGLGPISGGMLFDISTGFANRLLVGQGVSLLDELGAKIPGGFEVAIGKNGKIWVDSPEAGIQGTCAIGRCLQEADLKVLSNSQQTKLVIKVLEDFGLG